MTSRIRFLRTSRVLSALVVALILSCVFPLPAQAKNSAGFPDLKSFIESVARWRTAMFFEGCMSRT